LTQEQLEKINGALRSGETPDEIATGLGMTRTTMYHRLLLVGKRIVIYRQLENTAPADKPRELASV